MYTSENTEAIKNRVSRMLSEYDVANDLAENINRAISSHPLMCTLDCNEGPLRSEYIRSAFYKRNIHFVEPVPITVRCDDGLSRIFKYVPNKRCRHYSKINALLIICDTV